MIGYIKDAIADNLFAMQDAADEWEALSEEEREAIEEANRAEAEAADIEAWDMAAWEKKMEEEYRAKEDSEGDKAEFDFDNPPF